MMRDLCEAAETLRWAKRREESLVWVSTSTFGPHTVISADPAPPAGSTTCREPGKDGQADRMC